jgi:uncharacterized protein
MDLLLNEVEVRVLGALVEKEVTTPDSYPLSMNALLNACNQRSNRDPVLDLDEDAVRQAMHGLQDDRLAGPVSSSDSRVTKYEHRLHEVFNFHRDELAVLCVLLLRGPQTPGELRGRTDRLHKFEELAEVQTALQRLMKREPPLARILPRQAGARESRYMHLLSGDREEVPQAVAGAGSDPADTERIARLEQQVSQITLEVEELKRDLAHLKSQLE